MQNLEFDILAEGVAKSFGNLRALRGVDLKVKKGEFLTLFGPNGAGKTTLINILATLTKPTSGRATVAGHDVRERAEQIRENIGVISHEPFLYGSLTALENIKFFATLYGIQDPEDKARHAIEQVGLKSRMHDPVRRFSHGMKKRLSVARATVHEPNILLLDEPYTGLDKHGRKLFTDMLVWLKSLNRTVLMTTHHVSEGFELSDSVAILSGGRIVYESPSHHIQMGKFEQIYFEKASY